MKKNISILIVEDEHAQGELLLAILKNNGYSAEWTDNAEDGLKLLNSKPFDIVCSDWRLTDKDGLWLLQQSKKTHPSCFFILATAYGSIEHAVEAIKAGADDYLSKPFSQDTLLFSIERAVKQVTLSIENKNLQQEITQRQKLVDMVGSSKAMQAVFSQVEKLAATNATIHICGESGTGKELAARALHQLSERSNNPFVVINCGAIPEGLAEAELFGAEKGSFTGSTTKKIGKFEAANHGTIFLDEVAELPLNLQTKLLRVLQENSVTRIGSNNPIQVNVRVISATHKNLQQMVQEGAFREDLLYRLNVIPIVMPPLRERLEDLPALIDFFIKKHTDKHNLAPLKIENKAYEVLQNYYWPGNIRELGHSIERVILLGNQKCITAEDFAFLKDLKIPSSLFTLPVTGLDWETMEKNLYKQALNHTSGNKRKAAKLLRLSYKSFLYRLDKFKLNIS